MHREKTAYAAKGHSMGFGVQGNELSRGELILITEACALKHLLMNHQVGRLMNIVHSAISLASARYMTTHYCSAHHPCPFFGICSTSSPATTPFRLI